ncbi:MAG: hypothetical protein WCE93_04255 [Nitrososphaeraceae archaeon]
MPIKKCNKLVELRAEVVKGLVMAYGSGLRAAPDFTTFVNELLLDVVRREQFLSRYKPFSHLTYAGSHTGSLFVKDKQRKLVAEIIFKDGLVFCDSPDSASDCDHARFATSLIDVAKYLHDK